MENMLGSKLNDRFEKEHSAYSKDYMETGQVGSSVNLQGGILKNYKKVADQSL